MKELLPVLLLPFALIALGLYSLLVWLALFGRERPLSPEEIEEHDAEMAE